ncbi:MAG: Fusaric acid resistance protein-like-domain-containing protein, partial [Linnemannia gamsii]
MGRSFVESYPTRRFHEFGSSPARSLVHVLETAEAAGVGSQDDQWVTNASLATGTSGVHFQPQRGGQFAHSHFRRAGSGSGSGAWMATSMPESRFSEFEVVYDDGVRKQRTFSLTTELDEDERSSSDNDEDGSEHDPLLEYQEVGPSDHDNPHFSDDAIRAHLGYPGLMQGGAGTTPPTFSSSIPSTHNHSTTTPLLNKQHPYYSSPAGAGARLYPQQSKRRNKPAEYLTRASQTVWSYVSGNAIPLPTKRILKASLAYLLACLVSFTPIFLPYIGMSGHLAASSAVFFNPAKTLGRMVDAVTAGLSAIAFGVLVSVASMLSAIWFNSRDLYIWGHVVSVVVFGGGSTFIIAYAKAYFNRPTYVFFNNSFITSFLACTLSHIMILVTLTKEGAQSLGEFNMARVLAITTSMLLGVAITTLISIFLWPESAHEKLRQDMGKSLTSFRLLLKLLTKTFLLESDTTPFGSESVQKLIETQVKSFSALAKSLEEAQLEFPGPDIKKYESCVKSLNTLAQYLNGLRSSCGLQYDMLKKDEHLKDNAPKPQSSTTRETGPNGAGVGAGVDSGSGGRKALGFGMRMSSFSLIGGMNQDQEQSASADLIEFLEHVGKPMKSLALTCKLTIEHLQDIFTSTDGDKKAALGRFNSRGRVSHSHSPSLMLMQINLAKALDIFEKANSKALKRFYSHQNKRRSGHFKRPFGMSKPMSEPTLHDLGFGEQIFLVYFFVFNLMEFSKELTHLVNCVEELVDGDDGLPMWIERNRQPCNQGGRQRKQRLFPKPNLHNKTDTLHTPRPSTFLQKWSTRLWRFLHVFRSFQVKYAAKAAISTMVLLIPAFVDWTRPYFVQYRGEWALISMLIVMVPTVGGTNIVGIYRIMGTIVGCYAGVAIYLLFPANDILLPICCFLFAVPNFYLVLCSAYPRIGQVTLLAFNLVLIQTYNPLGSLLGETDPNDPNHVSYVWTIALHRAVAVSFGVVVGVAVTSYVWPYEARVELRKGLSDLLLNISWLYNRLVSVYSTNLDKVSVIPPQKPYRGPRERVQEILRRTTFQERMNKEFMAIELSLQLQLLRLYSLLEETPNEPRLKGKFPVRTYKNMLGSCQNILDRFLSMRLVITKDEWIESARRDFIVPVNKERREMVGNVLLYFYTIASALRLKTPLPPYLPPANNARLRLIQKIRQLPVVQNKVVMTEDN